MVQFFMPHSVEAYNAYYYSVRVPVCTMCALCTSCTNIFYLLIYLHKVHKRKKQCTSN